METSESMSKRFESAASSGMLTPFSEDLHLIFKPTVERALELLGNQYAQVRHAGSNVRVSSNISHHVSFN